MSASTDHFGRSQSTLLKLGLMLSQPPDREADAAPVRCGWARDPVMIRLRLVTFQVGGGRASTRKVWGAGRANSQHLWENVVGFKHCTVHHMCIAGSVERNTEENALMA